MNPPRILVAGVGNIFMGDDAFGCEVARRLVQRSLPEGVRVVDFGIRSLDLTYAMLDGYEAVILVDAVPRGQAAGTLYVIEPQTADAQRVTLDAHGMDLIKVLEAVSAMGGRIQRVLVVGCEPTPRHPDADWEMALSGPVSAALDDAVALVESLIKKLFDLRCRACNDKDGGAHHDSLESDRLGDPATIL